MKQPEHVEFKSRGRCSLPLILLPICVLCLLLLGIQSLVENNLMPHSAIARGVTRHAHFPKVIKVPGHSHHLAGKKQRIVKHAAKHRKQQHQHTKKQKKQIKAGVPTPTATTSATPVGPAPNLYIRQLRMGESHLDVGKKLTYVLFSGNTAGAASAHKRDSIVIMDVVPLGLTGLSAQGKNWKISISDTVSPAVVTATYDGSYPVNADTVLPPIFFTGTLTGDAEPSITNTATVDAPGDTNPLDSIATDTVFVGANPPATFVAVDDSSAGTPVSPTSSVIPILTAIATVDLATTPRFSMTAVATPAMTAAATPVMTAAATPAMTAAATPVMKVAPTPHSVPSVTATPMSDPTPRVVATPTSGPLTGVTATPTAGAASSTGPKLTMSISRPGAPIGDSYTVGQRVSYVLQVSNTQGPENQIVTVFDIAAVGISNVTFNAPGWTIGASNTVGPVALSGTFNGPYPIAAGTSLPPITVSGILTSASGPLFSNAAAVTSNDDPNSSSNISVDSISVQPVGSPTATATVTPMAGGATTPTIVTEVTITATTATTATSTATAVTTAVSTATTVTTATSTATPAATPLPSSTSAATATVTRNQSIAAQSALKRRSGIALAIVNSNLYGNYASVHGRVKLALVVANTGNASTVEHPSAIVVDEVIPLGLSNIQAQGKNWHIVLSDTTSPAVIHAQYIGKPALAPDMALPPISITGVLNQEAVPILTSTAAVSISGVTDSDNITASDTLLVRNASRQAR